MCEAFRSGLESVTKGQRESGLSIGLTESQLITNVILPQAFTVFVSSDSGKYNISLKETSVIGILALMELMYLTRDLIGLYYKTNESLFMLVVAYLIIILPVSFILTVIERRIRYALSGIDVIFKGVNLQRLMGGLIVTGQIALVSIVFSILFGLILGIVMTSKIRLFMEY